MHKIGIICEYNPFHNGHLYQIKKIKETYKDSLIIVCLSSCFMQRGEASILNKWDKTRLAIESGVDLVLELPFAFLLVIVTFLCLAYPINYTSILCVVL